MGVSWLGKAAPAPELLAKRHREETLVSPGGRGAWPGLRAGIAMAYSATIQARGPHSFFLLPGGRWGCPALSPLDLEVASSPPAPSTPTGLSQSQQAGSQGKHAAEPGAPR